MDMKLIMYTSTATAQSSAFVPAGLSTIARACRENNPSYGISGALYYRYGQYLQIIEGEPKTVNQLMRNILKDRRHEKCLIHVETLIHKRTYPKWQCQLSMIIERDPYLRQFLTQYSDKLNSTNTQMTAALDHFFKKQIPKRTSSVKKKTEVIVEEPHSVDQLVNKYGEDKRDEILVSLKNLNNQGLIQFVGG